MVALSSVVIKALTMADWLAVPQNGQVQPLFVDQMSGYVLTESRKLFAQRLPNPPFHAVTNHVKCGRGKAG